MADIPIKILRDTCKVGQGEKCCRYVVVGEHGIVCCKGSNLGHAIDVRVKEGKMVAKGDNCPGRNIQPEDDNDDGWVWP